MANNDGFEEAFNTPRWIVNVGAIISFIFTAMGIFPAIRKTNKNWLRKHYYYINGFIIGLFSAFLLNRYLEVLKVKH